MDQEKYECLLSKIKTSKRNPYPSWYETTEKLFLNYKVRNPDDLKKLIAFAYSWMPTIPKWREETCTLEKLNEAVKKIAEMEETINRGKTPQKNEITVLVKQIVPIINNSITGASKVLYFIFPETFPIIDSNVIKGWREIHKLGEITHEKTHPDVYLPLKLSGSGTSQHKHINYYAHYVVNMHEWKKSLTEDIKIRDIERNLYLLGNTSADKPKVATLDGNGAVAG